MLYLQDMTPGVGEITTVKHTPITIRPEDKISIIVNTRDPQLTNLFNLPIASVRLGQSNENSGSSSQGSVSGYTVDKDGNIDFPVVGKTKVAGMSREEIANHIKQELETRNLVKEPVVTVEFMNLCISVLGEVGHAGRFSIDRDRLTILDALSMAGDLTIHGNRSKVVVMREEEGKQRMYGIDLTQGESVYHSPVYYLQQNDVVYVEPIGMKARQTTVNGNTVRSTSFWLSLASFLTTISVLIFK